MDIINLRRPSLGLLHHRPHETPLSGGLPASEVLTAAAGEFHSKPNLTIRWPHLRLLEGNEAAVKAVWMAPEEQASMELARLELVKLPRRCLKKVRRQPARVPRHPSRPMSQEKVLTF
jgi:hypothetical protein